MDDRGQKAAAEAARRNVERLEHIRRFVRLDSRRLESNAELIVRRHGGELVARKCEPSPFGLDDVLGGKDILNMAADWETVLPYMTDAERRGLEAAAELRRRQDAEFERLLVQLATDPKSGLPPEKRQEWVLDSRHQEVLRHWYDQQRDGDWWWDSMLTIWWRIATRLEGSKKAARVRHSVDFATVNWFGSEYVFSGTQAACVKLLYEQFENGTPGVRQETLQDAANTSREMRHVFRDHPAWGTMIVQEPEAKGVYRLNPAEVASISKKKHRPVK